MVSIIKKLNLHTKVILAITLIFLSALFVYAFFVPPTITMKGVRWDKL